MDRKQSVLLKTVVWIFLFCASCISMGCDESDVATFRTDTELERYLKDQFARSISFGGMMMNSITGVIDPVAPVSDPAEGPSGDHSTTNIQEQGVDESDVVKTDGKYFYVIGDQGFRIVDIAGNMQVVATEKIEGYPHSLYLYDDKLAVLYAPIDGAGRRWLPGVDIPSPSLRFGPPYWIPMEAKQGVAFYDISTPPKPVLLKAVEFDGQLVSSRLVDGRLHIIQQFFPNIPHLDIYYTGSSELREQAIENNLTKLAEVPLEEMIPYYTVVSDPDQQPRRTVTTENFYHPNTEDCGGTIATIVTFNLKRNSLPFTSIGMVADSHVVYSSTQALYTGTTKFAFEKLDPGKLVNGTEMFSTILYKFDLTQRNVEYVGSGKINGVTLNQFSLGEYDGVLRVATTSQRFEEDRPFQNNIATQNNVFCLQEKDNQLRTIGAIENIAPGEEIYAARFIGKRGYLVTFVNIDPLFTLDLSDPTAPKAVGELKVPGYSDYIHPLGEDYLLTIGKDAIPASETFSWYQGVQLSIFDISDFANPELLHLEKIGDRGTHSEALRNHKAFTFWAEHDLLAIPVDLYEHLEPPSQPNMHGSLTFNGLYVYRVTAEEGFAFLGRVSTADESANQGTSWTRGVFVDENVYTVTNNILRVSTIDDPGNVFATLGLQ